MSDLSVVNNVEISYDEKTGITHFKSLENECSSSQKNKAERAWFTQFVDWYDSIFIKLYVKCRDINNSEVEKCQNAPVTAVEAGIRIDF